MAVRYLFVMDPLDQILPDKDTTFAFIEAATKRGHQCEYCLITDLYAEDSDGFALTRPCTVMREAPYHRLGQPRATRLDEFDAIFMRKDPPFDMDYVFATYILDRVDPAKSLVVNRPDSLRDANEKLYALNFPSVIPTTIVTSSPTRLKDFLRQNGQMIVKPLDGCGGAGIFHLVDGDRNTNAVLEQSTRDGRRMIIGQQYIPEVREGDKRIIILDGEPIGAVMRVPSDHDNRSNFHVGGSAARTDLTTRDLEIVSALAPRLREDGLYFVGIDVIGPYLTEVNVTSPTGIQEITELTGADLATRVIEFVETHAPTTP